MMLIFFSFLLFETIIDNIGTTQLSLKEPSFIEIDLQPNTTSYLYFSSPPNYSYASFTDTEKINIGSRSMFLSKESFELVINGPFYQTLNLTIWIIPSEICSNNARLMKTGQYIFSHWVFTEKLPQLCYFPVNRAQTDADITLITPSKLKTKSNVIIYTTDTNNNGLIASYNLTKTKKIEKYNQPFFILLKNAEPGTVFSYDIHFNNVIEDDCIDESFQVLESFNGFFSPFVTKDEPSFACSTEEDQHFILVLVIGIVILVLAGISILLSLVVRAYCYNKKKNKND